MGGTSQGLNLPQHKPPRSDLVLKEIIVEFMTLQVGNGSYFIPPSMGEHKRATRKADCPNENRITRRHGP